MRPLSRLAPVLAAVLAITLPFWLTDLDPRAAALFYHPGAEDPWFEGAAAPWSFFYVAAPPLTALILLASLFVLAAGQTWASFRRRRHAAVLVLAATLVGPGLLVNVILKEHMGRPRPHQTQAFGGTRDYLPPLLPGEPGTGKSFPSGHSSVGYLLGVFFLVWRRRRPVLAWMALGGSLVLGTLMGVGRMAAGDHFLSDVLWSWFIVQGTAWVLYWHVLRIPAREDAALGQPEPVPRPPRRPLPTALAQASVAVLLIIAVLLTVPLKQVELWAVRAETTQPAPRVLRLVADAASVILFWSDDHDGRRARLRLDGRGFGLPGSRIDHEVSQNGEVLTYRLDHRGVFSEKDTRLTVGIVAAAWERIEVRLDAGDIRVQPAPGVPPTLDLRTREGRVIRPPPDPSPAPSPDPS